MPRRKIRRKSDQKIQSSETPLNEQRSFIHSLFSINISELQRMEQEIRNFSFDLTELAVVNNFILYFHPKLTLEVSRLRILFSFILKEFLEQTEIFLPKFGLLTGEERYHHLALLNQILIEQLEHVFIAKSPEKKSQFLQKIVDGYISDYF